MEIDQLTRCIDVMCCAVVYFFSSLQSAEIARTAAWAISNLARGDKTPATPFLQVTNEVIASLQGKAPVAPLDAHLRVEAAWILAFLTAKDDESGTALLRAGIVPALCQALVDSAGEVMSNYNRRQNLACTAYTRAGH